MSGYNRDVESYSDKMRRGGMAAIQEVAAFFMKNDPLYSSLFLANMGSMGISDVFHHLYEYGTVSIFGAMSAPRRTTVAVDGHMVVEETLDVRWTFDERIDDAFSCAHSLAVVQDILEEPARHLGPPEGEPGRQREGSDEDDQEALDVWIEDAVNVFCTQKDLARRAKLELTKMADDHD